MTRQTVTDRKRPLPLFTDAEAARLHLEARRWHGTPVCPLCKGTERVSARSGKRVGYYQCGKCRSEFTVRSGTILARSNVPLHKWAHAVCIFVTTPESATSAQVARVIGVTQKTAWTMLKRLREALGQPAAPAGQGKARQRPPALNRSTVTALDRVLAYRR